MVLEDNRSLVVPDVSSEEKFGILRECGTLKLSDFGKCFLRKNNDISCVSTYRAVTVCMKSFFA